MEKTDTKKMTQEDIMQLLDTCYRKVINGIPYIGLTTQQMALDYIGKHSTKETAAQAMLKNQILKCTTSGFLTGFGGAITMPVTIPANIGSVLYVQMRMIACAAYIGGYDTKSDQTQSFVYACLAGITVNQIVKQTGIKVATKLTKGVIEKIPGAALTKINQAVGFRLFTKFGTKGVLNLGKMVPAVGAVVGGGLDYAETKAIANRAYRWFIKGDFSDDKQTEQETIVDADIIEETGMEQ